MLLGNGKRMLRLQLEKGRIACEVKQHRQLRLADVKPVWVWYNRYLSLDLGNRNFPHWTEGKGLIVHKA